MASDNDTSFYEFENQNQENVPPNHSDRNGKKMKQENCSMVIFFSSTTFSLLLTEAGIFQPPK